MNLNEIKHCTRTCIYADVVPAIAGHRGIGKTKLVKQIGDEWKDAWLDTVGIPVIPLYCAQQEVADLVGFPIKTWESNGAPVIAGEPSKTENDRQTTTWAKPSWMATIDKHCAPFEKSDRMIRDKMIADNVPEEEIDAFWNRPKVIVFLDEIKRSPREVLQAMYPFVLDKQLHTHRMPRGVRIVTADNFAGAYDLREPDEAFMSRFCHIEAECDIATWHEWAVGANISPRIRGFLTSNREMLMALPEGHENASVKYQALPDPRTWEMVDLIEKYGRRALVGLDPKLGERVLKQCIRGLVGLSTAESYWQFADKTVSVEDILTGKAKLAPILKGFATDNERNMLKQKLQIEASGTLRGRPFDQKEAERLLKFLIDLKAKDRVTAILQSIFMMKNSGDLDAKWVQTLITGTELSSLIQHLIDKKNV